MIVGFFIRITATHRFCQKLLEQGIEKLPDIKYWYISLQKLDMFKSLSLCNHKKPPSQKNGG
jgi:hypothetical protein